MELIDHTLRTAAPNSMVTTQSWYSADSILSPGNPNELGGGFIAGVHIYIHDNPNNLNAVDYVKISF